MIDRKDALSLKRQCEILALSRSGMYYTPVPVNERDMVLMREMDKIHTDFPFYGSRKYVMSYGRGDMMWDGIGFVA